MAIRTNSRFFVNENRVFRQVFTSITQYLNEPLVSFEEACQPLRFLLGRELEENMNISKSHSTFPADNLTIDESASIYLFTMEWQIKEDSLYAKLNQTLREGNQINLRVWRKYLKLLLTAFLKLPSLENQTIWRVVRANVSNDYNQNDEITWSGFSSCTSSIEVLGSPAYLGQTGTRTLFSIESSCGKSIHAHSYFSGEKEILLPPGTKFKVISKMNLSNNFCIIHLQEISSPFPKPIPPMNINHSKHSLKKTIKRPFKKLYEKVRITDDHIRQMFTLLCREQRMFGIEGFYNQLNSVRDNPNNAIILRSMNDSINGTYDLIGSFSANTMFGDINVTLRINESTLSYVQISTLTISGKTRISIIGSMNSIVMSSMHESNSGNIRIQYPENWNGFIQWHTINGNINIDNNINLIENQRNSFEGIRGNGHNVINIKTLSGNGKLTF
ncbi:unnamed protein product [Adineta ricciae]|uniref:NAD(P)(+)--arginine ADP-ribosyltransferase n=1 Tax=Adineta ricciae TaxID=249248 RepID=A0A816AUV1_ADIRI|nr:unnamed protein product [Adineta ricciae]CAF1602278.1 unnamed protein product [Adineta ricciae]